MDKTQFMAFRLRLRSLFRTLDGGLRRAAKDVGYESVYLSEILDGGWDEVKSNDNCFNTITTAVLMAYPEVSEDWLLRGEGEMFFNPQAFKPTAGEAPRAQVVGRLQGLVEGQEQTIRDLMQENILQRREIAALQEFMKQAEQHFRTLDRKMEEMQGGKKT